ncbi:MAG: hypothetical protein LBI63_03185 [Candidatus Ancillula sp.]|jgi:hypothetical protein|nr:hypothetical protein [Candidatus Ancillula sp.]
MTITRTFDSKPRFYIELEENAPEWLWDKIAKEAGRFGVVQQEDGWWIPSKGLQTNLEDILGAGSFIEIRSGAVEHMTKWLCKRLDARYQLAHLARTITTTIQQPTITLEVYFGKPVKDNLPALFLT